MELFQWVFFERAEAVRPAGVQGKETLVFGSADGAGAGSRWARTPPRPQGTCPVLELAGVSRCFSVQASSSPGPQHSESRAGTSSGEGRCSPQTTKGVPCRLVGQPRAARSRLGEIKQPLLTLELVE